MDYVFSHFLGIFLAAAASLLVYVAVMRKKSHVSCKLIWPSLASGVIWAIAQAVTKPVTSFFYVVAVGSLFCGPRLEKGYH